MPGRPLRRGTVVVTAVITVVLASCLSGCATLVAGTGRSALPPVAADAQVDIVGDAHTPFDRDAANAIADVEAFWGRTYPSIGDGAALPPLAGGVYSVDPSDITATDRRNACVAQAPDAIKPFLRLNLVGNTIDMLRDLALNGTLPSPLVAVPTVLASYAVFILGHRFFHRYRAVIVDVI